jgi:hypothetical protein
LAGDFNLEDRMADIVVKIVVALPVMGSVTSDEQQKL